MTPKHLLSRLRELIPLLSEERLGLFLDMDGTLSEIVERPEDARVSRNVAGSLQVLAERLALVAVVTGRASAVAESTVGVPGLVYAGNHGLERRENGLTRLAPEAEAHRERLSRLFDDLAKRFSAGGFMMEDKGGSFAVHYRHTFDTEASRQEVLDALESLAGDSVKLVMGKMVVNVLPPVVLSKGTALSDLTRERRLTALISMGDDVTDVDAFKSARELSKIGEVEAVCVAVVGGGAPDELVALADYTVENVAEVEEFLSWLARQTAP